MDPQRQAELRAQRRARRRADLPIHAASAALYGAAAVVTKAVLRRLFRRSGK